MKLCAADQSFIDFYLTNSLFLQTLTAQRAGPFLP